MAGGWSQWSVGGRGERWVVRTVCSRGERWVVAVTERWVVTVMVVTVMVVRSWWSRARLRKRRVLIRVCGMLK